MQRPILVRELQPPEVYRGLSLFLFLALACLVQAQMRINELSIDFGPEDNDLVRILVQGDCDSNVGIFGINNGAFEINDVEGANCCPISPLQGQNDNIALIGPLVATTNYCNATITIDVNLSNTPFEACISGGIDPFGCTAFVPGFDPGGDGFNIQTRLNGNVIMTSGYCGDSRQGIYSIAIGNITVGDNFDFLVIGGTQEVEESYLIDDIEISGRTASIIPASISTDEPTICEGDGILVLNELSGGDSYQWFLNGTNLNNNSANYNSPSLVALTDAGTYSVIVT